MMYRLKVATATLCMLTATAEFGILYSRPVYNPSAICQGYGTKPTLKSGQPLRRTVRAVVDMMIERKRLNDGFLRNFLESQGLSSEGLFEGISSFVSIPFKNIPVGEGNIDRKIDLYYLDENLNGFPDPEDSLETRITLGKKEIIYLDRGLNGPSAGDGVFINRKKIGNHTNPLWKYYKGIMNDVLADLKEDMNIGGLLIALSPESRRSPKKPR